MSAGSLGAPNQFEQHADAVAKAIETTTLQKQIALLRILVGCGDKAIEAFQAADNPLDDEFLVELKRVIERSRAELAVLVAQQASDGDSRLDMP